MPEQLCESRDVILDSGITPPWVIEPGRFHRFPGRGRSLSNRTGCSIRFHEGKVEFSKCCKTAMPTPCPTWTWWRKPRAVIPKAAPANRMGSLPPV